MENILLDFAISTVLTTVRLVVKNPAKKEQLKRVLLKVVTSIKNAYADDPDFNV